MRYTALPTLPPPTLQTMVPFARARPCVCVLIQSWFSIVVSMRQSLGISMPIPTSVLRGSRRNCRYSSGVHSQKWTWKGSSLMMAERAERSTILEGIGQLLTVDHDCNKRLRRNLAQSCPPDNLRSRATLQEPPARLARTDLRSSANRL